MTVIEPNIPAEECKSRSLALTPMYINTYTCPVPEYHTAMSVALCVAVAIQHSPAVSLTMLFSWNLAGVRCWKSADELPSFTELRSNPQHHSPLSKHPDVGVK